MAKTQTKEVAVIDFEKFSVAQLPELQGKKEEIKGIIEANPVVDIVDNSTYELAKKSRTAVRSLRTSLENEQKTVKKKIKEHILDVVDKEYDTFVLGVKSAEQIRQEPITAWEEKKEQERLEKVRLEEERVNGIKKSISDFRRNWDDVIFTLTFDKIEDVREDYSVAVLEFDRSKLAEFEVLFDDAIAYLDNLFANKEKTLAEQEQIRIDNLLIQEKNAENSRIQEWQRTWNANIDTLAFDDIKDVKAILFKSKLADLKHYSQEFEDIFVSSTKRLNSQIELISKAEEQRIAQEKFQKEKAEFEARQLEAKYQERVKTILNLGFTEYGQNGYILFDGIVCTDAQLKTFEDSQFETSLDYFKQKIAEFNQPKEEVKTDEIAQEQAERVYDSEPIASSIQKVEGSRIVQAYYHESDVDPKGIEKEVTWQSVFKEFADKYFEQKEQCLDMLTKFKFFVEDNYNVPTKKQ